MEKVQGAGNRAQGPGSRFRVHSFRVKGQGQDTILTVAYSAFYNA
jgi:hypothetical protein